MNRRHNGPPRRPPPPTLTGTAPNTLKHAAKVFKSYPAIFLFLSLVVFIFHSDVHAAVDNLSSRINGEPSLQPLLSRAYSTRRQHSEGMLDPLDFGSVLYRFVLGLFSKKPIPPNSTRLTLNSIPIGIVQPGSISFHTGFEENNTTINSTSSVTVNNGSWVLSFLIDESNDIPSFSSLSAVYAYGLLVVICTHYCINGVIFLTVMDHVLYHHRSFVRRIWLGWGIGIRSNSGLIPIRWYVRGIFALLIGMYVFTDIEDEFLFLMLFLSIKFMPFPCLAPWFNTGHAWDTARFVVLWFLVDFEVGLGFAVDSSVSVMQPTWDNMDMLEECRDVLAVLFYPAVAIRLLEAMVCGSVGKWVLLSMVSSEVLRMFIQAMMVVYFKIAWVVFHLAAMQVMSEGPFTRGDFKDILDDAFGLYD